MQDRIDLQKEAILSAIKTPTVPDIWHTATSPFTRENLQRQLDEFHDLYIPETGAPIVLDFPLILRSGTHLRAAEKQVFLQSPDSAYCLLRNEHIQNGAEHATDPSLRDRDLSVEGGIWHIRNAAKCYADKEKTIRGSLGAIIFCGVEQIALRRMLIHDSEELCGKGTDGASYGIQLCDCRDFTVEEINFADNHRDGVHINGPAAYGHLRHIRGEKMGDDMIALNAWDWYTSAITFGSIEHVVVEDAIGGGNELRLLPGQKLYEDGSRVDCDIRDIVLENIRGVYTFKLYTQPNIANVYKPGLHDVSGTVGTIENVSFRNIVFSKLSQTGFNDLPIDGMFDIAADLNGLTLDTIEVMDTLDACFARGARLVSVGPLSATWKTDPNDPSTWGEVFAPDAVCHATNIRLKNIRFDGVPVTEKDKLVRTVKQHINDDYPHTTPKGGTGYGTVGDIFIDA